VKSPGAKRPPWLAPSIVLVALMLAGVVASIAVWALRRHEATQRSHAFDRIIRDAAQRHRVPPLLVKAVIWKESRFHPLAVGSKGEVGLMQITDAAVTEWHRGTGYRMPCRGIRFSPTLNIEIGTWYLAWTSKHWRDYRSAVEMTLAEYNAGYGNVTKEGWIPASPQTEIKLSDISFPGTREYIRQILMKWHQFEKEHRQREE
jgi:soluble lytic murein transglycosylase